MAMTRRLKIYAELETINRRLMDLEHPIDPDLHDRRQELLDELDDLEPEFDEWEDAPSFERMRPTSGRGSRNTNIVAWKQAA